MTRGLTNSEEATDVFAHLVLPVGPVMAALGTPVVQVMVNAFAGEDFGEAVRGAAVFPRAGAGGDVDVARCKLAKVPGIVEIREIVDGVIEIKIVVVHAVREIFHVVDAGHGEAALDDVGMFEERVGGVIRAEGSAHGGNSDALRLAIVVDEGHDLFAEIGIEHGLDIAAMERMRGFVVEAVAVDGIDAKEFDLAAVNKIGKRADHALAFELPFVAGAGGIADERRPPMAKNGDAQLDAEPRRMPAVVFAFDRVRLMRPGPRKNAVRAFPQGLKPVECLGILSELKLRPP